MPLRVLAVTAVAIALASPALASEPGQPLTTENWVMVVPGLTAQEIVPWGTSCAASDLMCEGLVSLSDLTGADGAIYYVKHDAVRVCEIAGGYPCWRIELRRLTASGQTETVAYIDERPSPATTSLDKASSFTWAVDPANGFLYLRWRSYCLDDNNGVVDCTYGLGDQVTRISGLPTTFEILQSYTPTSGPLSFRVPYMPSGLPAADYFDTYYGDLATVGDWSLAKPLQCGYPSTPPSLGDYLEVADTSPPLAAGSGRYYVTAVTHQGQRRFGRQRIGGLLSGRSPAELPACE